MAINHHTFSVCIFVLKKCLRQLIYIQATTELELLTINIDLV